MEFSVGMALVDFLPVILFAIAAVILQRDLYEKMSKGAYALFAAGTIDIIAAGGLKALYKLLYALGVCDFERLSQLFFPLQSIGFMLAGLGLIAMLTRRQGTSLAAAVPAKFSGTFVFVFLMVAGLAFIDFSMAVMAGKLKKKWLIPIIAVSFVCCLGMGYLSTKDFANASMNWIAEAVNTVGQGLLLAAVVVMHKAGLPSLSVKKD